MLSPGAKHRPENVNTLINWIVCCCSSWQSPAILCPTRRFWGYFRINDFLQPGEAPPGLEQTFPQLLAKGGKGLSQEVSPCWLQNPKWFIACLSGSYFKSQWFIESNAYILYNEAVLQYCQHKSGTCCLFLLSSNPSKPTGATFHFYWNWKCQLMVSAPQNPTDIYSDLILPTRWYLIFQIFMLLEVYFFPFFPLFFVQNKQNNNHLYFEEWERFLRHFWTKGIGREAFLQDYF